MLTIKYINTDYEEMVRGAYEVRIVREWPSSVGPGIGKVPVVYADLCGAGTARFDSGKVFVMNDAGATVARYDLGGWPEAASVKDQPSLGESAAA